MKYLIMRCEELMDQYECDANRWPEAMTDNWQKWYEKTQPDYLFEVYEYKNNTFECIKEYDRAIEEGMVFVWFDDNTPEGEFNIIKRYPHMTRHDSMPDNLYQRMMEGEDIDNSLKNCGSASWSEGDKWYAYTEYADNRIYSPY